MTKKWKTYEEVAAFLLNKFCDDLDLKNIEGKQKLSGKVTNWEIDGKGISLNGKSIIVIECRHYEYSRQPQEKMAAFAYKIQDLSASGGIIVSPLGLQTGANRIAEAENIINVSLSYESTIEEYLLKFLNMVCFGLIDSFSYSTKVIGITKNKPEK